MSFRITTLLFGLFLGVLWIFGLMLALGRSALDQGFVLPKFAQATKANINYVEIDKEGKKYVFSKTPDGWRLKIPPNEQQVRVEDSEIDGLIDELRTARHNNDETDINRNLNDERWGLFKPKITVTMKNADGGEWQFFVGKESEDKAFAYVNSSERKRDVLAVRHSALSKLFFDDINKFRLRRLLEAKEVTARRIDLKETKDDKVSELELEKPKDKTWWFKKPPLGPADYEGSPSAPDQSVRSLIAAVTNLRVEDFEPIGSPVTVDEKNALLRIEVESDSGETVKKDKDKDKSPGKTEVLLIGDKVRDKDQYFAKLASDNSVVRVSSKQLDPVFALIKDPRPLRSHDVALIEPDKVDAVEIIRGKESAKIFKRDEAGVASWRIYPSDDAARAANSSSITGPTGVLDAIKGKQEIKDKDFVDAGTPEKKKELEAKFAPEKLEAKVMVWADSLQPEPAKKEEKKEEGKDDKKLDTKAQKKEEPKADKKDDKKADKKQDAKSDIKQATKDAPKDSKENKKDEAKADQAPPKFKDGAKPEVTLSFVRVDKDKVLVKRDAPDVDPVYFNLAMADFDKIVPRDMALAFFDTTIKSFFPSDAVKLELSRAPLKDRAKLLETFLVERESKDKAKEPEKGKEPEKAKDKQPAKDGANGKDQPKDSTKDKDQAKDVDKKDKEADKAAVAGAKSEWKLIEPKEFVAKGEVDSGEIDTVLSTLANVHAVRWVQKVGKETLSHYGLNDGHWTVRVSVTPKKEEGAKEPPKPFVLRLGDSSNKESDKGAVFAYQEGTDYVFLVDNKTEKVLKDAEFRDRHLLKFDPTKVKELRVSVATSDKEIRKPVFEREPDKSWKDKKDTLGFKIDSRKVDDLVDTLSNLQVVRYLNVKGELPKDYDLGAAAPLKFEVVMDDGKTIHTVTVGAASEKSGPYYAQSSALPGGVFLVGKDPFGELMGKVSYFRKD